MKGTVKTKMGDVEYIFEIENDDVMQTLNQLTILGNPPTKCNCGVEGQEFFKLYSNKADNFTYVYTECKECGAKANLGQNKDKLGYFWKNFEVFKK